MKTSTKPYKNKIMQATLYTQTINVSQFVNILKLNNNPNTKKQEKTQEKNQQQNKKATTLNSKREQGNKTAYHR